MLLFSTFVTSEEISLFVRILPANHINNTARQTLPIKVTKHLEDIDTVPPKHTPTFLGGSKIIKTVSHAVPVIQSFRRFIKDNLSTIVNGGNRKLNANADSDATHLFALANSRRVQTFIIFLVIFTFVVAGSLGKKQRTGLHMFNETPFTKLLLCVEFIKRPGYQIPIEACHPANIAVLLDVVNSVPRHVNSYRILANAAVFWFGGCFPIEIVNQQDCSD